MFNLGHFQVSLDANRSSSEAFGSKLSHRCEWGMTTAYIEMVNLEKGYLHYIHGLLKEHLRKFGLDLY